MSISEIPLTLQSRQWERTGTWEEWPVLTCSISLPEVCTPGRGARRINRYYRRVDAVLRRWLARRYHACCRRAQQALAASRPLPSECVLVTWEATYQDARLLSLVWTLEAEGQRRQFADLWTWPDGLPANVRTLLPRDLLRQTRRRTLCLAEDGIWLLGTDGRRRLAPLPEHMPRAPSG